MHRYVLPVTLSLSDDPPTRLPFGQGVIALAVGFCIRHTGVFYQSHLGYLVFHLRGCLSAEEFLHSPWMAFSPETLFRSQLPTFTHSVLSGRLNQADDPQAFTLGPIKLLPENLPVSRPYWEQVPGGEHGFSLLPRPTSP